MIQKKFQIFVSSTYADLKEERSRVFEAILGIGHIPVGMEYFGSRSRRSDTIIKNFIDQCDFQITIVGTRYGSLYDTKISYTEMEYKYANKIGVPQLGFLQKAKGAFVNNSEDTEENKDRLKKFREKVARHQCAFWENPAELVTQIQQALSREIAECTRPGWIRGDSLRLLSSDEFQRLSDELSGVKSAMNRYRKNVHENNRQRLDKNLLPTPQISGLWQCQEKPMTMELFEYAGALVSHSSTGTHDHWIFGTWSPENNEIQTQTWRRERLAHDGIEKRLTIMFGRIFNITESTFSSEILASDGKADLKSGYQEHLTWKRLKPSIA